MFTHQPKLNVSDGNANFVILFYCTKFNYNLKSQPHTLYNKEFAPEFIYIIYFVDCYVKLPSSWKYISVFPLLLFFFPDDESCCSANNNPPNNHKQLFNQKEHQQQHSAENQCDGNAGNAIVGGNQHVTLPSPEQTEPDSTTTLRHFRKASSIKTLANIVSTTTSTPSTASNTNSTAKSGGNGKGHDYYSVEKFIAREMYNCHLCDETFSTTNSLRKHRSMVHNNNTNMPFVCTICKRGFRVRNALQRHMETHDVEGRPYECTICQVRFPRPSQLTLHKLTVHKFEKVHTCDECGKQFATESSLKAHEKVAHEGK